jgi:hypothetical protein
VVGVPEEGAQVIYYADGHAVALKADLTEGSTPMWGGMALDI